MAKVLITMPDQLLKKMDKAATSEHRSRSEWLREAARAHLERANGSSRALLTKPSVRAAIALQERTARELRGVKFDTVAFIRQMRRHRQ